MCEHADGVSAVRLRVPARGRSVVPLLTMAPSGDAKMRAASRPLLSVPEAVINRFLQQEALFGRGPARRRGSLSPLERVVQIISAVSQAVEARAGFKPGRI